MKFDKDKINPNLLLYWLFGLTLLAFSVIFVLSVGVYGINHEFDALKKETEAQNKEYETEIEDLKQRVTLLAEHVSEEMEVRTVEEAKKNPVGIPVSGQAVIVSDPSNEEEEEIDLDNSDEVSADLKFMNSYTLEISVSRGTKVIASGNGVVTYVGEDDIYGHIVKIDHGNGYVSVYRYSEEPKIKEGDEVLKGQMIYEVAKYKGILAYHILYENNYINPIEMIEISG